MQSESCISTTSSQSTFQILFGNTGHLVVKAKEEKDHPDCYRGKVQKPASVTVWGCVNAHCIMGNLHIHEGTIKAEKYIQVLGRQPFQGGQCLFQSVASLWRLTVHYQAGT